MFNSNVLTLSKYSSSQQKTVALEAPDAQTCMYWLQQLQTRRKRYSKRRTALLKEQQQSLKSVQVTMYFKNFRVRFCKSCSPKQNTKKRKKEKEVGVIAQVNITSKFTRNISKRLLILLQIKFPRDSISFN